MLAKVDHPEGHGVANIAPLVLKLGDVDIAISVARTIVKLGHVLILLGDRVAEWSSDILDAKDRLLDGSDGALISERVVVTVEENRTFKLVVGHG